MIRRKRSNAVLFSLTLAFVSALGAGVMVGMAAGRYSTPPVEQTTVQPPATTRPAATLVPPRNSSLPDQLGLTSDQRDKLRAIWTEAVHGPAQQENSRKRAKLLKQRDEALYNLMSDDQKQQYQKLMSEYGGKLAELNKDREKAIVDAVDRTKSMLSEAQRAKYDQILKEHGPFPHGDRPHGPRGRNGPGHAPPHFGESQPFRNGPAFEDPARESGNPTTRPG